MKVKLIATGEVAEFNDAYAARLTEQGKAFFIKEVKEEKPKKKAIKKAVIADVTEEQDT